MTVDQIYKGLAIIAGILVSFSAIFAFLWKFFIKPEVQKEICRTVKLAEMNDKIDKKAEKQDLEELDAKVETIMINIEALNRQNEKVNATLEKIIEAQKHTIQGVYACLEGLKQQGCNGEVSASYKQIKDYLFNKE